MTAGSVACSRSGPPRRRRSIGRVALAALATGAWSTVAAAQGIQRPELVGLTFSGNEAFPADSLRRAIVTRRSECRALLLEPFCWAGLGFARDRRALNRRELPIDLVRLRFFYYERGYREAQIDTVVTEEGPGRLSVTFLVEEGRPVRVESLTYRGIPDDRRRELLRNLPVAEGDPLIASALDATRDSLLNRLRNSGHAHADIFLDQFIPADRPYAAQVAFDVEPGPLARFGVLDVRIQTSGANDGAEEPPIDAVMVQRMLPFRSGDRYSREQVLQAQRNLYGLEIIRNAAIRENLENLPDTLVPLSIAVSTSDVHRVRGGGGWSTAECISPDARWVSRNFLGGARRVQVRGRLSNVLAHDLRGTVCPQVGRGQFADLNWSLSFDLNQPWLFSPRNSLTANVFWERQSLPDVFIREAVGLNLAVTRALRRRTPVTLGYRPQRAELDAAGVFFCTSFVVCTPGDIDVLQRPNWLAPVALTFSRDRTDDLLDPSNGYSALLDLELAAAATGSDFAYRRVVVEANRYHALARRTIFAGRIRLGWVGAASFATDGQDERPGIVHPQRRFYAGGANSVRGFAQNRLGPRVLTADVSDLMEPVRVVGADTVFLGPCSPEQLQTQTCDAEGVAEAVFTPRPTGGTRVLEAGLEYRFAIGGEFQAVTFLDVGQVWGENDTVDLSSLEWAPGVGVRYFSPIGPLRLDIGYRFRGAEELPVVTSLIRRFDAALDDADARIAVRGADGGEYTIPWVRLDDLALQEERVLFGSGGFFRRLQIHVSIGQAF